MGIVDFEVLALVVVASAVLAKLFEAIKDRARRRWDAMSDTGREVAGYVIIVVCAGLMWLTGLNFLPGFSPVWGPAGRILSCVIAGFGPSTLYDMFIDKPNIVPVPVGPEFLRKLAK